MSSFRVVIVNAYGHSNRGDSVLLDECITEIRRAHPNCEIGVALYEGIAEAAAREPGVTWAERIGNRRPGQSGLVTLWYVLIGLFASLYPLSFLARFLPEQQQRTLNLIRNCQLLVSAPGGYIHDTNAAFIIALLNLLVGINFGKFVVLAPQSIGPIKNRTMRAFARFVLSRCNIICTREPYSNEFVTRELGISTTRVIRVGDAAFWNSNVETDRVLIDIELNKLGLIEGERFVGITVVGWSFPHHQDPEKAFKCYVSTIAHLIEHIQQRHNLRCVIFNQVSDDITVAEEVQRFCKVEVLVDRGERDPKLLRGMIAASDAFVGTRFHSCIFALSAHVPTFAIAYLPKTSHILNDVGLPSHSMPIDNLNEERLFVEVDALLFKRSQKVEEIISALSAYRDRYPVFEKVLEGIDE